MGHDVQHCIISDDTLIIKEIALTARMFKIEGIEGLSDLNIFELLVKPLPNQIEKTAYGDQAQSIRYNIIEELKTIVGDYSDQMLLAEALKAYIFAGKNLKSPEYYEKYTENCLFVDWDGTLFIDGKFSLENFEFAKMHSEIYDGKLKIWTGGSNLEKIREILIENLGDKANDIEILQKQNFYGIEVAGAMDDNREKEETSRYCFKVQHYINI